MKIRYIYSACVVIETGDIKLLCDPWFTPGAYYGAWHHFPPLPEIGPIDLIGKVDAIWVSHIHPDHYDPIFLGRYLARYPSTRLFTTLGGHPSLKLAISLEGLGDRLKEISLLPVGDTLLRTFPNNAYPGWNIDSALLVTEGITSVVNMNDNPFDPGQVGAIKTASPEITVALLPYCGAGPYPHCYELDSPEQRRAAEERKKAQFLQSYNRYVEALNPHVAIPFAGQFIHKGWSGTDRDPQNSMADATEVLGGPSWDRSVVLADYGDGELDTRTLHASSTRTAPYPEEARLLSINNCKAHPYHYQRELMLTPRRLKLDSLFQSAAVRAERAIRASRDRVSLNDSLVSSHPASSSYWFCFRHGSAGFFCWDALTGDFQFTNSSQVSSLEPRCEMDIDPRLLFGLLTHLYDWNSVEAGSLYTARRVPDLYNREAYRNLHYLRV